MSDVPPNPEGNVDPQKGGPQTDAPEANGEVVAEPELNAEPDTNATPEDTSSDTGRLRVVSEKLRPILTRTGLSSAGFQSLVVTQTLTSLNDNLIRWLIVAMAKPVIGDKALSLGLACFTLPYLLLMTPAGFLADRFRKKAVIVGCKCAEILIVSLGMVAILTGQMELGFVVVFAMGCQSALFSPARLGAIPELVHPSRLSPANGVMGMVTVASSAVGAILGFRLVVFTSENLSIPTAAAEMWPVLATGLGIAGLGLLASLRIRSVPAASPELPFPRNPIRETISSISVLKRNRLLLRTALGIGFFWMLASLASLTIEAFGFYELGMQQQNIGLLLAILVVGLGAGSLLAGYLSGGKAELALVPLGAFGIVMACFGLYLLGDLAVGGFQSLALWLSCGMLFGLGLSAGLFDIPLEAFLQERSPRRSRGTILAASNFITFSLILLVSALFYLLRDVWGWDASSIFLLAGLATVPIFAYVFYLIPQACIRCVVWVLTKIFYRIRVNGLHHLPEEGGGLVVLNHVSWLDGILMVLISPRPIRMIAYADYVEKPFARWICERFGVIPIKSDGGPKALLKSLQSAQETIEQGELVGIFAEGALTRTGQLQGFQPGVLRILKGTDAPVIPCYLDELWGSVFSFHGGRFFWKKPNRFPYPISMTFGPPIENPASIAEVHRGVQLAGVTSQQKRKHRRMIPARQFIRRCRESLRRVKIADSTGPESELTGGKLLTATYIFKHLLEADAIGPDEKNVGLLVPPSVGGVLANMAVTLMNRVSVNLNYTLDNETMNYCIEKAGIKTVITSRKVMEKRPFDLNAKVVYLEDLKEKVTTGLKLRCALKAMTVPTAIQERMLGLHKVDPSEVLTIIFTSGSTGQPKGVMLTHDNVMSNVEAVNHLFHFTREDVMVGVLPFFHSFGYTGCLWLTMALDISTAYHFNPLDAKTVGELSGRYGMSIILATPTFLRAYTRRCTPEQFRNVSLAVVGAEKMPPDLAVDFEEKFGVPPVEGYGCTELSPVASFNVPDHRLKGDPGQPGSCVGSVGRAMPGTAARCVDPDTGAVKEVDEEGLLQITGPNVMLGYLDDPEKTAEVVLDGWYNTGDFAKINRDGFITITGRQSRFSKLGGEMVPHIRIEQVLTAALRENNDSDGDDDTPEIKLAVTAVPDPKKGEKLIVLHKPLDRSPDELRQAAIDEGLPNLWIPARDAFIEVDEIPLLGTGKLDLRAVKQMALDHTSGATTESV